MGKILIVDDESQLTSLLDQALKAEGYRTATASGGEEALRRMAEDRFNLVLSDMMMPGMSGLDLMRKTHEIAPGLVFVLMTAYGQVEDAVRAIQEGAADYITKPFPLPFLKETIRRALNRDRRAVREGAAPETPKDLFLENRTGTISPISDAVVALDEVEKTKILEALDRHHGNRTHAAKALRISLSTLKNKLRNYRTAGL